MTKINMVYDVVEKLLQKTLRHIMYFVVSFVLHQDQVDYFATAITQNLQKNEEIFQLHSKNVRTFCVEIQKIPKKISYLSYGNYIWNSIQQNIISISYTKMTQSKAANVQNQMEKVIQCQKTHQKVKIPQNLKNYHGKIKILQDNRIFY